MGLILGLKVLETKGNERLDKKAVEQGLRILAHMIARAYVRDAGMERRNSGTAVKNNNNDKQEKCENLQKNYGENDYGNP